MSLLQKQVLYKVAALVLLAVLVVGCAPTVTPTVPPPPVTVAPPTVVPPTVAPGGDAQYLPNPQLTPGAYNSAVTQDTIQTTICVPGYSSSIRPPVSYTDALKVKQLSDPAYGDTADQNTADYEEDHFVPLSIGGNPTDPKNLWPQPRNTPVWNANTKDTLEYTLYKDVCAGIISLATAQQAIVTDWVQAFKTYVSASLNIMPMYNLTPEP